MNTGDANESSPSHDWTGLPDSLAGFLKMVFDAVFKTGESSNIPLFSNMLARIFGREKVRESNAFTSVVAGLAIKAKM